MARVAVQALVLVALAASSVSSAATPGRVARLYSAPILFARAATTSGGPNVDIFRMDDGGRHVTALAQTSQEELDPLLSPNGTRIAFERNDPYIGGTGTTAWVMDADGRNVRQLAQDLVPQAWAPDNRRLIASRISTQPYGLYIIDLAGQTRFLTSLPREWAILSAARWSPDGKKIAFTRVRPNHVDQIFLINPDGTHTRRLASGVDPEWSPDGRWIAFSHGDIFKIKPDGTNRVRLTKRLTASHLSWSPIGNAIAFATEQKLPDHYGFPRIAVVRADGTGFRLLTKARRYPHGRWGFQDNPVWSPDGSRLVYLRFLLKIQDCDACDNDVASEVWTIERDGRRKHELTPLSCYWGLSWAPSGATAGRDFGACIR